MNMTEEYNEMDKESATRACKEICEEVGQKLREKPLEIIVKTATERIKKRFGADSAIYCKRQNGKITFNCTVEGSSRIGYAFGFSIDV